MLNALRHQRNWNQLFWGFWKIFFTCSTPYGIKGIGTINTYTTRFTYCGAQRLTASKELEHGDFSKINGHLHVGAQRLTASKELEHFCQYPLQFIGLHVLNALRHQRNWNSLRIPTAIPVNASDECSTPYGIKGIGTSMSSHINDGCFRAQRLTASKELEQKIAYLNLLFCSRAQRLTASKELELRSLERHPRAGL